MRKFERHPIFSFLIFIVLYPTIAVKLSTYSTYTDNELLRLLSRNNIEAFDNLYTRHWAEMYKSAFFILKEQDACKDIVQDIFVWLWEHRQVLEIHTLKSYLKAAVKFKVANYIRSQKIRKSFFEELADYSPSAMVTNSEEMAEINELKAIIHLAIIELPDKCREIFRLSREEHLSNREIADRLGISVKTVENQMTIALSRIRRTLEPYMAIAPVLTVICFHQYLDKF